MFDQMSANAITGLLPSLTYSLPYFGEVNFQRVVGAVIVFVVLTLGFWILRMIILTRARMLAEKTSGLLDDVVVDAIQNIRAWVYSLVALYAALQFFSFPTVVDKVFAGIFYFAIVWQAIEVASRFVEYFTTQYMEKDEDGDGIIDPNSATASHMVTLIARIVLWSLGTLFVLSNLGIEITSLIAGLGIGGVAVAFALQGVLGDLFASFSIYFDKPFRIGDFIVIGNDLGTVEKIGIKSTRIKTLQGEELVVSNAELTSTRVQNFKKMEHRRIVIKFGVTYETPQEKVREIPSVVTKIFESIENAALDRAHFISFGDSALIFEVVYIVDTPDYNEYMDIQQAFNFALLKQLNDLGINFAYPTQTLYTKVIS